MYKKLLAFFLLFSLATASLQARLPGVTKIKQGVKKVMGICCAVLVAALIADPATKLAKELANPFFWKKNLETKGFTGTAESAAIRVLGISALTYFLLNAFEYAA